MSATNQQESEVILSIDSKPITYSSLRLESQAKAIKKKYAMLVFKKFFCRKPNERDKKILEDIELDYKKIMLSSRVVNLIINRIITNNIDQFSSEKNMLNLPAFIETETDDKKKSYFRDHFSEIVLNIMSKRNIKAKTLKSLGIDDPIEKQRILNEYILYKSKKMRVVLHDNRYFKSLETLIYFVPKYDMEKKRRKDMLKKFNIKTEK
ncbi:MAG: hypothetical protein GXP32_08840 [Kiritimatiellaeota bacterium]|nr:hypothetical protein [Kiritimatiellota bacterium]